MNDTTNASVESGPEKQPRCSRFARGLLGTVALVAFLSSPLLWRELVQQASTSRIYSPATAPDSDVAVVFGAAVYGDGRLSAVLRDRMDTAIALYQDGKVSRILVSGDNRADHYDEPGAMKAYAVARGVPEIDVQPDQAGLRTSDTCYRAREIFQLDSAILVTQQFHMPRALFTCRGLGIDAVGVAADLRPYRGARWYEFRETAATMRALWDVLRREPPPALAGDPMPSQIGRSAIPYTNPRR